MLELVSAKLSANFKIIVKEHPEQVDLFHRSDLFYKIIGNIKKFFFTNVNDTKDKLIQNCSALITIAGSASFEALQNKKKVITFGQAW